MAEAIKAEGATRRSVSAVPPENVLIELDVAHPLYGQFDHPEYDQRMREPDSSPENLQLLESLRRNGFIESEVVNLREVVDSATGSVSYRAVNGRRRIRMTRILNIERIAEGLEPIRIPVVAKRLSDMVAKERSIDLNTARPSTPLERGHEVLSLHERFNVPLTDIANRYLNSEGEPATIQTLHNWMFLARLHPDVQDAIRKGGKHPEGIGSTAALTAFRDTNTDSKTVPLDKQPAVLAKLLAVKATGEKVTSRNSKGIAESDGEKDTGESSNGEGSGTGEKRPKPNKITSKGMANILEAMETTNGGRNSHNQMLGNHLIALTALFLGKATLEQQKLIDRFIPKDYLNIEGAPEE